MPRQYASTKQKKTMRNQRTLVLMIALIMGLSTSTRAQNDDTGSTEILMSSLKNIHNITKTFVGATAEILSEEMYAYRPTDEVMTAGQLLAHIADSQFGICSYAAGEENPSEGDFRETATTKDEILVALKDSYDYCDGVYDTMTDAESREMKPFFQWEERFHREMTASAILSFNSTHTYEHYGNLVTYMRINGIVPPSSR